MDKLEQLRNQMAREKGPSPGVIHPGSGTTSGLDWRIPVFNGANEGGPTINPYMAAKVATPSVLDVTNPRGKPWDSATLVLPDADNEVDDIIINLFTILPQEYGLGTSIWPAPIDNSDDFDVGDEIEAWHRPAFEP